MCICIIKMSLYKFLYRSRFESFNNFTVSFIRYVHVMLECYTHSTLMVYINVIHLTDHFRLIFSHSSGYCKQNIKQPVYVFMPRGYTTFQNKAIHIIHARLKFYLRLSLTVHYNNVREASHIDFVHEKRHMDVGGEGEGVGACDVSRW